MPLTNQDVRRVSGALEKEGWHYLDKLITRARFRLRRDVRAEVLTPERPPAEDEWPRLVPWVGADETLPAGTEGVEDSVGVYWEGDTKHLRVSVVLADGRRALIEASDFDAAAEIQPRPAPCDAHEYDVQGWEGNGLVTRACPDCRRWIDYPPRPLRHENGRLIRNGRPAAHDTDERHHRPRAGA